MPRTDKFYRRLEFVESELRRRLHHQFAAEEAGTRSSILGCPWASSDEADAEHIAQLHRISRQVESLRKKLGEPTPGPVLTVLSRFRDAWNDLGVKQSAGEWRALVKQALAELEHDT